MDLDREAIAHRFGDAIRRRRIALGLTQRQLAEILDPPVPREIVGRAERAADVGPHGPAIPTIYTVLRYADALEANAVAIMREALAIPAWVGPRRPAARAPA